MITLSYSTCTMMQISGASNKLLLQQLLLHQDHLPHHPQPQGHLQHPLLPQHLLVKIGLQPNDARGGSGDQRRPRDATRNFSVKGAGRLVKSVHLDFDFKTKLLSRGRNTSNHLPITLFVVSYTRCLFQKCQHSTLQPCLVVNSWIQCTLYVVAIKEYFISCVRQTYLLIKFPWKVH